MRRILRWTRGEEGATAVEYAVMLTLIVITCLGAIRLLGSALSTSYTDSTIEIETYMSAS
jgi:Flp pilus assembly pilin Flp